MRLSCQRDDAGYNPNAFGAIVTVDGVLVDHCHTADEDLGEARCYAVPLRLDTTGTRVQEVVLRGNVVIKFTEML